MRYIFRVLVLGDPLLAIPFMINGGVEHAGQDAELSHWAKSINIGKDDIADLEIDVVVTSSADFDTLIPTSDGILYFINPNKIEDFDLFEMIVDILFEVRREIPIVIIFNDNKGVIRIPSNLLIENIWENYPFEAFVYDQYSKNTLYLILECLTDSMISNTMPINIETAWMRIPFFMDKINRLVLQEKWSDAAQLTEILTQIKKKFDKQDYYITAEQAGWLYYKSANFLKASAMLQSGINETDALKFKEFYVQDLITQGDRSFKIKRYRNAAEKYEKAALWASIELNNLELNQKSLNQAITTWVSACEIPNAFKLIDKLDHADQLKTMQKLTPKIASATDYLISQNNFDTAKTQLYYAIDKYQRAGLFEDVKILAEKMASLMKVILQNNIQEELPDESMLAVDEIINIWETFDLKKENIDSTLESIARVYLKKHDFSAIDKLLMKVTNIEMSRTISELRAKSEEEYKKSKDSMALADYITATIILEKYITEEIRQFAEEDDKLFNYINELRSAKQYWDAVLILKEKAQWYKKIEQINFYNKYIQQILNIYLESEEPYLLQFLQDVETLSSKERSNYLIQSIKPLSLAFERKFNTQESTKKIENLLNNFIKIYRSHLLYEESKDIVKLCVKFKVQRAGELLNSSKGLTEIPNILTTLKEAEMLYGELNERISLNYDYILQEIVKRYISENDLSKAAQINEKIKNKNIFSELHTKILKIESEKSQAQIQDVRKVMNWKIKAEQLSLLKNHARDMLMNLQSYLKTREGLKRVMFKQFLEELEKENYSESINLCKEIIITLVRQRKIETAGISLAVLGLLLIKTNSIDKINTINNEINLSLGASSKLLYETFPAKVLDYIKEMYEFKENSKAIEAIALYENIALFPEERKLLLDILGKEASIKETQPKSEGTQTPSIESALPNNQTIKSSEEHSFNKSAISNYIKRIESFKGLMTRRNMMKRKYWETALTQLGSASYSDAADEYFNQSKFLFENNHSEFGSLSIILGIICMLKMNRFTETRQKYGKITYNIGNTQELIEKAPELVLLEQLINAFTSNNHDIISLILEGYLLNLPLFDIEKNLIVTLSGKEVATRVAEVENKDKIQKSQSNVLLDQQLSNLKKSISDLKSSVSSLIQKRQAMRRIYYNDLLDKLNNKKYDEAADQYKSIATRISQRNDYEMAGLLILFGSLCFFKKNTRIDTIKEYINSFLDSLGFTKKVIDETLGVKIAKFLIEASIVGNDSLIEQCWQLLKLLPLFDEEKDLIVK